MKIVNIVPGFGGRFYCGNCLRDTAFVGSLRQAGHDAIILPVYLPLVMDGKEPQGDLPVFYGAVNIYLKQQFPFLRKMPSWMEHALNSSPILKLASRKAGSTRAHGMEELTESMLLGDQGFQRAELKELVTFLKTHEKPDIVHFSNALLLGMAKVIKEELRIPVVCSLQDEDVWVDAMTGEHREKIWQILTEKARDIDAFIAVSDFYARRMTEMLSVPSEKMHVIHIGIKPDLYTYSTPASDPPAIGFLSRTSEENGFGILVDAFIRLKSESRLSNLQLHYSGGMTSDDRKFIQNQMKKLRDKDLFRYTRHFADFSLGALSGFFRSISVLSVPVLKGEAFGLYQLEAMASGIPLVQPDLGAFREIIDATGGGVVYHPNHPDALAATLAEVLTDEKKLLKMSKAGHESVQEKFDCAKLTRKMIGIYQQIQ